MFCVVCRLYNSNCTLIVVLWCWCSQPDSSGVPYCFSCLYSRNSILHKRLCKNINWFNLLILLHLKSPSARGEMACTKEKNVEKQLQYNIFSLYKDFFKSLFNVFLHIFCSCFDNICKSGLIFMPCIIYIYCASPSSLAVPADALTELNYCIITLPFNEFRGETVFLTFGGVDFIFLGGFSHSDNKPTGSGYSAPS